MPRTARIPARHEITDETMMPLSVAAEVAVAHGVVSSATTKALKREADLGRLVVYEVFGRLHTTLSDIKKMLRQSVVSPKGSGLIVHPNATRASALPGRTPKQRCTQESDDSPSKQVIRSLRAITKPPNSR